MGATTAHAGPCFGDNGTPSLQRAGRQWMVVGLQSRGINGVPCGESPSVMTDLGRYQAWIYDTIFASAPL